jgi:hypothetical protein
MPDEWERVEAEAMGLQVEGGGGEDGLVREKLGMGRIMEAQVCSMLSFSRAVTATGGSCRGCKAGGGGGAGAAR